MKKATFCLPLVFLMTFISVSVHAQLPTVTTALVSNITSSGATSGGTVNADAAGNQVTSRGVCWTTSALIAPTTSQKERSSDGTGSGSFSSLISGLASNTTYYVRAYAVNSSGTAYGSIKSFTTAPAVPVTSITVSPTVASIAIGATQQLSKSIAPTNASIQSVTWKSSNTAVATVNTAGLVTGVSAGSATITVTTTDGGKTAVSTITIYAVPVTGVTLSPTSASFNIGATQQLSSTVSPSNATNKNVTWRSNNTAVATVSTTGLVTGVSRGSVTITVTTTDGGKTAASSLSINPVPVTGVTVSPATDSFNVGATKQLLATLDPTNATYQNVTWRSSNTAVATVNSSGLVTGVSAGSAIITVTTADGGKTASSNVSINKVPVTGVTLSPTTASLTVGATQQLVPAIAPINATNKNVSWISSNPAVATANTTGLITGMSAGSAIITVTTADGGKTATSNVTVNTVPVTGLTVSPSTASINNGATQQLSANITPTNATNKNIIWRSNNTAVAAVSTTGLVTGLSEGTATITALADNGAISYNAPITVMPAPVTGVILSSANAIVNVNNNMLLKVVISPEFAANKNVTWSSSNTSIARVNASGATNTASQEAIITGVSAGTAVITVTTADGAKITSCNVTVGTEKMVTIGSQVWSTVNLDVTRYRNGDLIPQVTDPTQWSNLTTGAWCWYKNDSSTYAATYGRLYNWYAVHDTRGLCPSGWHVPSDADLDIMFVASNVEWTTVTDFLGGQITAGDKVKNTNGWPTALTTPTNSSGFSALPGGGRNDIGGFDNMGSFGYWWSATEKTGTHYAWYRSVGGLESRIFRDYSYKERGMSVRCVKD